MERAFNYSHYEEHEASGRLKIGEVSKRSGVGIETLTFYEKSGLLDRPVRTNGNYRLYDESVLDRLAFIKQAQILGFTLAEIKQIINHKRAGENPCAEVREIVKKRLDELDEKIRQMLHYREELTKALAEWEEIGEAEGHVCGLIEGSHIEHGIAEKKTKTPKPKGVL